MSGIEGFPLSFWDYLAFVLFFAALSVIGYLAGRKERGGATDYFLAGKKLPWYVVGGSFIASNISSEHFIGMIGAACIYGVCVATAEWMNVATFSLLIWFFIPFLLASRVFTTPEFLERRFNPAMRQIFAVVTVISNVVAFLAAVLYGGALALHDLFGWNLTFAIVVLGVAAGMWAIYGGLSSVAWTDLFTVVVMVLGGTTVTVLGLYAMAGTDGSLVDGLNNVIELNQAAEGQWQEAVSSNLEHFTKNDNYNRLSVFQPLSHPTTPWLGLLFGLFSVSLWYNVLNQFMIQRVLGAKNAYHARMGIVFAGFLKVFLPFIVVLPGMILFAMHPEVLLQPWADVRKAADSGYVNMLQTLVPIGLRGLFLAALFGAIQSTVNSVLNSTATVLTLDIYKRNFKPNASDKQLVRAGVFFSVIVLTVAIVFGRFISFFEGSLFVYIQSLYAFFAPPFAAVFLLGILWKRINGAGALTAVILGFVFGIGMKVYVTIIPAASSWHPAWLDPYSNQAAMNWVLCMVTCIAISLLTPRPAPERITDDVTVNWSKLNLFDDLGNHWYSSVVTWWLLFVLMVVGLLLTFSGLMFPTG